MWKDEGGREGVSFPAAVEIWEWGWIPRVRYVYVGTRLTTNTKLPSHGMRHLHSWYGQA